MKKSVIYILMVLVASYIFSPKSGLSESIISIKGFPEESIQESSIQHVITMELSGKTSLLDSNRVNIASLSYIPVKWNKDANIAIMEKMIRQAASEGAQVLVTPEGALEGYLIDEMRKSPEREKWEPLFFEIAEPLDGPSVMKVREWAKELGVDIVLGFLERNGDILYNSCAWIDPNGNVLHVHRKTQLAEPYFDPPYYHPGSVIKAFDTRFGRVGMLICYERQFPEVSTVLVLKGARILINPSYGSRGEWNTTMLRTRARDNEIYLVFTHPKQTLILTGDGDIVQDVDNEEGAGIVYAELKLPWKQHKKLLRRRPDVFTQDIDRYLPGANQRHSKPGHIKVATVQMHSDHDLKMNVDKICSYLAELALKGVRVVLFPECATTGYFKEDIPGYTQQDLIDAELTIAKVCLDYKIFAVIGTPYFENGQRYNMALVIDDKGETIFRQAKINLLDGEKSWAQPGNRLGLFHIDGELCSVLICHDSRYPELVRLPVIKGSRLVFYLSSEGNITNEREIEPYRAQVVARAVENRVYVVQANTPQRLNPLEGSHGQSRIVDPRGQIISEASIFREEVLIEVLDLTRATGELARKSLQADFLNEWWNNGLKLVEDDDK